MALTADIYVRLSEDKDGEGMAVERQEEECRDLAARLGLTVGRVFSDNDISASKGKARPGFDSLLESKPAAILAWHQDRLLRVSADLEKVIALDIPVYTVTSGTLDLTNPAGRAVARTVAAWSQYEGEQKALRQRAENAQRVKRGFPIAGKRRYGFLGAEGVRYGGNVVEHPVEGPLVREAFRAMASGTSSVWVQSKALGLPTITTRRILTSRAYIGEVFYDGQWYPANEKVARLTDVDTFEKVQAILSDPTRKPKAGNQVSHLASGIARCWCGETMRSKGKAYICRVSFAHVSIRQVMLDDALKWEVFTELSREDQAIGANLPELEKALRELEEERVELSGLLTQKGVAKAPILARLAELDTEAETATEAILSARAEHIAADVVAEIRAALLSAMDDEEGAAWWENRWSQLDLTTQRELVRTLSIVVHPGRGTERVAVGPR